MIGVAKRLALHPPPPGWGRRMVSARGGLATQRRAKAAGVAVSSNLAAARAALAERQRERREGPRVMAKRWLPLE